MIRRRLPVAYRNAPPGVYAVDVRGHSRSAPQQLVMFEDPEPEAEAPTAEAETGQEGEA